MSALGKAYDDMQRGLCRPHGERLPYDAQPGPTFGESFPAFVGGGQAARDPIALATTQERTAQANAQGVGYKADEDKPDWSLLDLGVEEDIVRVLTAGAKKYARDNWRKVPGARDRYLAALLRHLSAWQAGELADPETGLPHLAHAGCCLHFLAWFDKNRTVTT